MAAMSVEVEGLVKQYGDRAAVDGIDLNVETGSIHGLIGPNGAGKTTTVRMLATLLSPDAGRARVAGFDVRSEPDRVRERIGWVAQAATVDAELTTRENLIMIGRLRHLGRRKSAARAVELIDQFHLGAVADTRGALLSGGTRRRLDIAQALANQPDVLFLDEPSTGLDPQSRLALWSEIERLKEHGATVLLTTQAMDEADHLCSVVTIIDHGTVVASGQTAALKAAISPDIVAVQNPGWTAEDAIHAAEAITGVPGIDPPVVGGTTISVAARHGAAVVADIVHRLAAANAAPTTVSIKPAALEDVYLKLTGHVVRGEGSGATPPSIATLGRSH